MVSSIDSWRGRRDRNGGGEKCGEKDSMGGVTVHTMTLRQCVLERFEWRREVM